MRDAFAATIEREMASDLVAFNDAPKAHTFSDGSGLADSFNDGPGAHAFNDSPPAHAPGDGN